MVLELPTRRQFGLCVFRIHQNLTVGYPKPKVTESQSQPEFASVKCRHGTCRALGVKSYGIRLRTLDNRLGNNLIMSRVPYLVPVAKDASHNFLLRNKILCLVASQRRSESYFLNVQLLEFSLDL